MAALFRRTLYSKQLTRLNKCATFTMDTERKAFLDVLPEFINSVVTSPKLNGLPDVENWMKKLLEYTLDGGQLARGLMVSTGYRNFEEPDNFSEEKQHSARILGWCLEMLQAQFSVLDDIADSGTTRRGKPCWYLQLNVGIWAVNDSLLMTQATLDILDIYFGQTPIYGDLLRYFNEAVYRAVIGEHLDLYSSYNKEKDNIDVFNMERVSAIAINKLSYYTFKLSLFVPLLLVKNGKHKDTKELHNICMDLGRLMQCQNDYVDAYGDEIITGKNGRDIQEGKCTWVAVTALQHCNNSQRSIFKDFYGSEDPEHVKRIKQLYDKLQLPQLYKQFESTSYNKLVYQIQALRTEADRNFVLHVLNGFYKKVN